MPKWALLLAMLSSAGVYANFFRDKGFLGMAVRASSVYLFCVASFALAKVYAG